MGSVPAVRSERRGALSAQPVGWAYSYGAVAAAGCAGAAFPQEAAAALGPLLLVGLVGLGVAHGACDQLVLPAYRPVRGSWGRYLLRFSLGYLGLAGVVGLVWWRWPAAAVGLFFGLTVWHWGSADAPAYPRSGLWVAHSVLRGALLLAVPAWWWPAETAHSVNGLLQLTGGTAVAASLWAGLGPAVVVGHLALWGFLGWQRAFARWRRDAREVLLLTGLLVALPPLLALGVYFVFWHSLQHVLRLTSAFGYVASEQVRRPLPLGRELFFFGRRALPVFAVSLAAVALPYALGIAPHWSQAGLGLAVVAASVVTLPHALLVSLVMDAPKWRPGHRAAVGPASGPTSPVAQRGRSGCSAKENGQFVHR